MSRSSDPYLTEQLGRLEALIAARPDHPEARRARQLVRRVRYYQMHVPLPRTRRYLLGDLRAAALQFALERNTHD